MPHNSQRNDPMVAVGDALLAITSLYSLFSQSTNPLNLKASFNVYLGSELSSKCPVLHIGEVILDIFHVKYILGSNLEPKGRRWLLVILTDFLKGIFSKSETVIQIMCKSFS